MPRTRVIPGPPFAARMPMLLALALAGCSAARATSASVEDASSASSGAEPAYAAPAIPPLVIQVGSESPTTYDFNDDLVTGDQVRPDSAPMAAMAARVSESESPGGRPFRNWFRRGPEPVAATTPAPAQPAPPADAPRLPDEKQSATDAAPAGPILVYTASFLLSVYEVDKAQAALKQAVQSMGGFVSVQNDQQITLRVPADKFEAALTAVETSGKVRARNVQALDVGDDYRDLSIRLHTAEAVRTRLEAMLARADKIDDALRVEKELERVVREIEQLKGQLRSLTDRIAFSTLIVEFRPEVRPDIDDSDVFRLPYPWLDELGLHHLLELNP